MSYYEETVANNREIPSLKYGGGETVTDGKH